MYFYSVVSFRNYPLSGSSVYTEKNHPSFLGRKYSDIHKRWPAQKSNLWTARRSSRVLRGGKAWQKKWSEMTEQEVNRLKQQQCMKCEYYSRLAGDGVNHATCEYITRVGHSRGCSPLECKQKGIFEPRRTQRRRKS